ncbi:MAG: HAD-IC family P-type ATPase, partial [Oscillospiraceae bacterium]|nr:HAD-IC family P-type ATPase [Oscillospiraceae bacterium]
AGIRVIMMTGDHENTAREIARQAGIEQDSVRARIAPSDKLDIVRELQRKGHVVAVTGDGINDAPAIKNADVGIAMGITGTQVSQEAADIVLLDDSFATIVQAVEWGRGIYDNFRRFIAYQLTVNLSTVFVVLAAIVLGFGAPFTALQLLWINIIMDGPPAIALGLEPISPKSNLMKRKPIKRNSPIISGSMGVRIFVISGFIVTVALSQRFFNFLGASDAQMHTVFFALFATFKLFNALNSRELGTRSIFADRMRSFFANRLALAAVGIAFVAQVCLVQFGGAFFRTVPLELTLWLKIFAVGASVIAVSELLRVFQKLLHFRKSPKSESVALKAQSREGLETRHSRV